MLSDAFEDRLSRGILLVCVAERERLFSVSASKPTVTQFYEANKPITSSPLEGERSLFALSDNQKPDFLTTVSCREMC